MGLVGDFLLLERRSCLQFESTFLLMRLGDTGTFYTPLLSSYSSDGWLYFTTREETA